MKHREVINGYCLIAKGIKKQISEKWCNKDIEVFICPTLHSARKILFETPKLWSTRIYEVRGNVNILSKEKGKHGLIYTDEPTKLIITNILPGMKLPKSAKEKREQQLINDYKENCESRIMAYMTQFVKEYE